MAHQPTAGDDVAWYQAEAERRRRLAAEARDRDERIELERLADAFDALAARAGRWRH